MIRILIIKLGALGDVVRTLAVLPAIKKKFPDSEITWITKQNAIQYIENNPYIKKAGALPYNPGKNEKFDIIYNFDVEDEATALVQKISAGKKFGFYSQEGFPSAFNLAGEYYLNTMFDDELKKNNKKTYQQMMFEAAELDWHDQASEIFLTKQDKEYAQEFLKNSKINSKGIIGIHMGAGPRWPSKAWSISKVKEFIIKCKQKGYEILLFGGPEEINKLEPLVSDLKKQNISILRNNPRNTQKEFASLVDLCKAIVCSDSLALHVSLALKKPTIGLFFCTSANEVEGYGLLRKIISPMLSDFFPEKMDQYSEELVNSISSEQVLKEILKLK